MATSQVDLLRKICWQFNTKDALVRIVAARQAERIRSSMNVSWSRLLKPEHSGLCSILELTSLQNDDCVKNATLNAWNYLVDENICWDDVFSASAGLHQNGESRQDSSWSPDTWFQDIMFPTDTIMMEIIQKFMESIQDIELSSAWARYQGYGTSSARRHEPETPENHRPTSPIGSKVTRCGNVPLVVVGRIEIAKELSTNSLEFNVIDGEQNVFGPIMTSRPRICLHIRQVGNKIQRVTTRMGKTRFDAKEAIRVVDA